MGENKLKQVETSRAEHAQSIAVDEEIGQVSPTSPTVDSAHSPLPGNVSCFDPSMIDDGVQFY